VTYADPNRGTAGDPLADIHNTTRIEAVILNGQLLKAN